MGRLVIGSRASDLALTQTNYIADRLREAAPDIEVVVEIISTKGDRIRDVPLAKIGGKGLFTKEIEAALLDKRVDLAVHSLKDLPTELPEGLCIGAIPERENPRDALIGATAKTLDELPEGARVGTSSLRRKVQLLAIRPDLEIVDLRGNVPTRLRKLKEEGLDAIILATAGLNRLGLADAITQELPQEIMLSAVGQGALGLECRCDDTRTLELLARLNHAPTEAEVTAERALLRAMGGGCQVPIGALGRVADKLLTLYACVCGTGGEEVLRVELCGSVEDAAAIGEQAAERLMKEGATVIIARAVAQETGAAQPLAGKRIVVTRSRAQAPELVRQLAELGADVYEYPTIEVEPLEGSLEVAAADAFDWVVFTSVNGVEYFAAALEEQNRTLDEFRNTSICAVGGATSAALRKRGIPVALTPEKFIAESLLEAFVAIENGSLAGKHFLMPRGNLARSFLPAALRERDAKVTECTVYRTVAPEISRVRAETLVNTEPDYVTFTSSSTARNFCASLTPGQLERLKAGAIFASIGPITTETAEELGLSVGVEPDQHDVPNLVQAITVHAQAREVRA